MQKTMKSIILGTLLFQSLLLASDLPDRGGKYGTITKSNTTTKMRKTTGNCQPYMQNAIRVKSSNYGIAGRYKVFGYTTTYKCGHPYAAEAIYTQLYALIGGGLHKLCGKGKSNTYHYKASCSYRWFGGSKPRGAYAQFAARIDGYELRRNLHK